MSKIKIGIVEDEAIIADTIAITLTKLGYDTSEPCSTYTAALEMLDAENPDLVLVDIQLAGRQSGTDLGKMIRAQYNLPFIYLTSNSDPATLELAKATRPDAFLVKPFNKDDLYSSIEVALFNFAESRDKEHGSAIVRDAIFIKQDFQLIKVAFEDLHYLKSDHVYVEFHCSDQRRFVVRGKLTDFLPKLSKDFLQVHRRYMVNLSHITAIGQAEVTVGAQTVPVSKSHRDDLLRSVNRT